MKQSILNDPEDEGVLGNSSLLKHLNCLKMLLFKADGYVTGRRTTRFKCCCFCLSRHPAVLENVTKCTNNLLIKQEIKLISYFKAASQQQVLCPV